MCRERGQAEKRGARKIAACGTTMSYLFDRIRKSSFLPCLLVIRSVFLTRLTGGLTLIHYPAAVCGLRVAGALSGSICSRDGI